MLDTFSMFIQRAEWNNQNLDQILKRELHLRVTIYYHSSFLNLHTFATLKLNVNSIKNDFN